MKLQKAWVVLFLIPFAVWDADAASNARVGMARGGAAARMPSLITAGGALTSSKKIGTVPVVEQRVPVTQTASVAVATTTEAESDSETDAEDTATTSENCREAYQACMDEFCLLDETEGGRCACSDNINRSKRLIQEIQQIQAEADELYTVGVEKEKLGAKAKLVFGSSAAAKKSAARSGIDFSAWLNSDSTIDDDDESVGEDADIGQSLYDMAAEACAAELQACGSKSTMEEKLYTRQIVKDCKAFDGYLKDQKIDANANKKTAEAAVRSARLEMLNTTNKYNRGECLLVYRSCIADKGGCGVNFENCLDEGLLSRRANACEDVLDQCMAVSKDVLKDWKDESVSILAEAAKYADKYQRQTCLAKIQSCLEEGCSTSTESMCLSDVNVAAGICPIITECNDKIPGLQPLVNKKLSYLRVKFCENDIDGCLKDKCGTDFTKPECIGQSPDTIATTMCPQTLFPSCQDMKKEDYDVIINSAMLHMDYQLLTGCINQFSEKLTAVCGADMACIPTADLLGGVEITKWVDLDGSAEGKALQASVQESAKRAVDNFFEEFSKDKTLSECASVYGKGSAQNSSQKSVEVNVNMTAKLIAEYAAKNRALLELGTAMDDIKAKEETDNARKYCLQKYKEEKKPELDDKAKDRTFSYIRSVTYEPDLHNCHVCRMQQVCEKGGEKRATSALKAAAGGLSAGASAGTMVSPGWGTAIGGLVGAVGAGAVGAASGGQEEFCQQLESCEDINVSGQSIEDL